MNAITISNAHIARKNQIFFFPSYISRKLHSIEFEFSCCSVFNIHKHDGFIDVAHRCRFNIFVFFPVILCSSIQMNPTDIAQCS